MSSTTHGAMSDCSYPESENEDLKFKISKIRQRLTAVMKEEANLRRDLEELLDQQEAEALKELKKAEENIAMIRVEREQIRRQLRRDEEHARVPSATPNGPHDSHAAPASPSSSSLPVGNNDSIPMHLDQSHKSSGTTTSHLNAPAPAVNNDSQTPITKPKPEEPKPRYRGNKVALRMVHELEQCQKELEKQKLILEEAEETAKEWDYVSRKCAESNLRGSSKMGCAEAESCRRRADTARGTIEKLQWDKLLRTEILAQLKEDEGE